MNEAVRLSIITPVLNGVKYIDGCIQNVVNQKCAGVEHIIIDGGSTDGTAELIKQYAQKYPHIYFESNAVQGQSSAMNKGLALARGKVIGILNVDDFYEPGALNRMLALFLTLPEPGLLVGNCYVRGENDEVIDHNRPQRLRQEDLLVGWSVNPFPVNPSAYLYSKALHQKIGLYNEADHYSLDIEFLLKAVTVAHVRYVDEFWGNFRFIKGTKTYEDKQSGGNHRRIKQLLESYLSRLPFLKRIKVRAARFVFKHHKVHYFYSRICYYAVDPKRISGFLARRLNKS